MDNIKIYRFFAVNKKASLYVFNKVNEGNKKLDKLAKEYIKKYSDTNLFDTAAKREKNLHFGREFLADRSHLYLLIYLSIWVLVLMLHQKLILLIQH